MPSRPVVLRYSSIRRCLQLPLNLQLLEVPYRSGHDLEALAHAKQSGWMKHLWLQLKVR